MAGEVRDPHPAGNQEAGVVGKVLEVAFAYGAIPPNEGIAVGALPRRRSEERAGDWTAEPVAHKVAEVFPDAVARSEIVLMGQQTLDEPRIGRAGFGDAHGEGLEFAQRTADRFLRGKDRRNVEIATRIGRRPLPSGQRDAAGPLELEQQRACGHVLEPTRCVAPIPELTQLATQPCAVPLGMRLEESANPFDIGSVEFPPLHDHDACHRCKIEPLSK